jgi:nanoRNase/pAp phosphatase (c-di-AMP/oligoRNAs hydrolase)/CBS domain-containing protein
MNLIATHKNADFDGFAGLLAAGILYPEALPCLPKTLNANVKSFYTLHKKVLPLFEENDWDPAEVKKLIVVDVNAWSRLEIPDSIASNPGLEIHIWDHHQEEGNIKGHQVYIQPVGAATSLLVTKIEQEQKKLTSIQATLFLAGIYEDSGSLSFPSTTPADARAAAFLLEQGADLNVIKKFIRPIYGLKQKEIFMEMLKNETKVKVNGYQISYVRIEVEGYNPGLSPVVDRYQEFSDSDATFAFFIDPKKNQCMVISRSQADTLNVGQIMIKLGGGGHPNAGSAIVKSVDLEELETLISSLIRDKEKSTIQISDLMSFPVKTVAENSLMKEVALLFREKGCTAFPVTDGPTLTGIISRRDFKRAKKQSDMSFPVKAFMSRNIIQISPEQSVAEATRLMVKHHIGRLPVMTEDKLIGIITRSDIMRYYYDMLPE